jgi:transposase-like protein
MQAMTRELRGKEIAQSGNQIQRLVDGFYKVASQSRDLSYDVRQTQSGGWMCTCPDHAYRLVTCKHIYAVQFSLNLRKAVEARVIEPITDIYACIYCRSDLIIKWGVRHNCHSDIQKFLCKSCGKYFTVNLGFERMKHNPQGITTAMQLYFSGESLRNTARSLKLIGVEVSYKTVWKWIQKYTELMEKYLSTITPQVGDTWRADEVFLKVHGDLKYLYALMDDQTRFWIAQEVAETKLTADVRPLFQQGKQFAGKQPVTLITDGAPNFHEAYMKEYWTMKPETRTKHVQDIRMDGTVHNNKMERMNGEIRDREKVTRNLKKMDTPILTGMQIFHNYVRPHMALDGQTPADKAGIKVEGENKWLTIIQNASQNVKSKKANKSSV